MTSANRANKRMFVRVHVVAGAKKERIVQKSETEFDMSVKEPAARNLANGRVRELLAEQFGVTRGMVRIVSGHHSPTKMFAIED